jgi:hypothetical protein
MLKNYNLIVKKNLEEFASSDTLFKTIPAARKFIDENRVSKQTTSLTW